MIAVNSSHVRAPFADAVFAMDRNWWNEYGAAVSDGPELWTTNAEAARVYGLHRIKGEPGGGISTRRGHIRLGGNSGYQALGLALHFGAARVVLLGYDMQLTGGQTHWHGDHARLGNPVVRRMKDWIARFSELAAQSKTPIINATRETALRCFPCAPIEQVLEGQP